MEPEPPKMEARPPALIDAAVRRLIPPAREHVVGDLWERYVTPRQYVGDVLRTLPFVVASQIRRPWDLLRLTMQILPAFVFFGGLRSGLGGVDQAAWLRAAVPTIAVAIALVLRDAYRSVAPRSSRHFVVDSLVAVACALSSQAVLAVVRPDWLLAQWAAPAGSAGTFVMLLVLRSAMPSGSDLRMRLASDGTIAVDDFARDVRQFERRIRQRNRRELLAGLLVIVGFGVSLWRGSGLVARIGCGLAMAGALFIIHYIRTRAVPNTIPTNVALSTSIPILPP